MRIPPRWRLITPLPRPGTSPASPPYSGVSRTLVVDATTLGAVRAALAQVSRPFIDREVQAILLTGRPLLIDIDLTSRPVSPRSTTYPDASFGWMDDSVTKGYQSAISSLNGGCSNWPDGCSVWSASCGSWGSSRPRRRPGWLSPTRGVLADRAGRPRRSFSASAEIDVIGATRRFLQQDGLQGTTVLDLFTDAHPSLLGAADLRPFQRFTLAFDGFAMRPDLLAVEAKGGADLLRGIAQAELYRRGFHLVLLACAGRPPQELLTLARQRAVGVLAVLPNQVELLDLPPAHLPQLRHAERIRRQLALNVALVSPFSFNLPTHYLAMAPVLQAWAQGHGATWVPLRELDAVARAHYPTLPRGLSSLRAALHGAAKLSLVALQADRVALTFTGRTVAALLPAAPELARIHAQRVNGGPGTTLAALHPQAGAVLRLLLSGDPVARLFIDTLQSSDAPLSMRALVLLSAERDRALTPAVFFKPEAVSALTGDDGQILWHQVQPQHFRSTTFFQYKSVLKHAGILVPHALGGSAAKGYNPDTDLWELTAEARG